MEMENHGEVSVLQKNIRRRRVSVKKKEREEFSDKGRVGKK
jgi:hypothetical protein